MLKNWEAFLIAKQMELNGRAAQVERIDKVSVNGHALVSRVYADYIRLSPVPRPAPQTLSASLRAIARILKLFSQDLTLLEKARVSVPCCPGSTMLSTLSLGSRSAWRSYELARV